jgi:hypothetical protein
LAFCRFPEVGFRVLLPPELAGQMPLDTTFGNPQSFGNVSTAEVGRFFPALQDFLTPFAYIDLHRKSGSH